MLAGEEQEQCFIGAEEEVGVVIRIRTINDCTTSEILVLNNTSGLVLNITSGLVLNTTSGLYLILPVGWYLILPVGWYLILPVGCT